MAGLYDETLTGQQLANQRILANRQSANQQPNYSANWLGMPGLRGPSQQQPGSWGRRAVEMFGGAPASGPAALGYQGGSPVFGSSPLSGERGLPAPEWEQLQSGWWRNANTNAFKPPGFVPPRPPAPLLGVNDTLSGSRVAGGTPGTSYDYYGNTVSGAPAPTAKASPMAKQANTANLAALLRRRMATTRRK